LPAFTHGAGATAGAAQDGAPVIDLHGGYRDERGGEDAPARPGWLEDFLSHMGQSEGERNPNADLHIDLSAVSEVERPVGLL
jgi:hypothetical protein